MWYEGKGVISIGCQNGGPKDNGIGKIKGDLWKRLCEHCTSTYCDEVDHYAIALRVGGKIFDYEEENIWRIRRSKKDRFIGVDVDIPASVWSTKTTDELKYYLADKITTAIQMLITRLRKDKVEVEEQSLFQEINAAISEFKEAAYTNMA